MITTSTGAKKIEGTDNWREIFDAHNDSVDAQDKLAPDMAPIVNGNKCVAGASAGDYVLVRNSSITGITDGAYIAAQAIPANTAIDSTYLTAISGGALNSLNSKMSMYELGTAVSFGYATEYTVPSDGLVIAKKSDSSSSLTLTIVKGNSTIEVGRTTVNNAALHLWARKGMKVKTGGNDNNSTNSFYPLE